MIADALRAEIAKCALNRTVLAAGVLTVPALVLLFGVLGEGFVWATLPDAGRAVPRAPLITDMSLALTASGNPLFHAAYAMAAAVVFAGEYRWETWRFIVPRNTRANLLLAKFAAFAGVAALGLALTVFAGLAASLTGAALNGVAPAAHPAPGAALAGLALAFAASLLQLCAIAALAAFVSVATRSMMAAVLAVFLLSLGQAIFLGLFGELTTDPRVIAALPNLAGDTGRRFAFWLAGDPDFAAPHGPLAFAALALWAALAFGGALALFLRQDLSQE